MGFSIHALVQTPRLPDGFASARRQCQDRIMAKGVVVVDVLVSQCDCRDALCNQRVHAMDAENWIAVIDKAECHPVEQGKLPCLHGEAARRRRPRLSLRHQKQRQLCGRQSLQIRSDWSCNVLEPDPILNSDRTSFCEICGLWVASNIWQPGNALPHFKGAKLFYVRFVSPLKMAQSAHGCRHEAIALFRSCACPIWPDRKQVQAAP